MAELPHPAFMELARRRQWVTWEQELRADGTFTKVPKNPRTGANASSINKRTWGSLDEVKSPRIGYVLTPDDRIVFIDLDKCRDPETGEIAEWAMARVRELNSYTETSPSKTGLHVLVVGTLPEGRRRSGHVEMYCDKRFMTITGDALPGFEVIRESRAALESLWRSLTGGNGDAHVERQLVDDGLAGLTPDDKPDADLLELLRENDPLGLFNQTWTCKRGPDWLKADGVTPDWSKYDFSLAIQAVMVGPAWADDSQIAKLIIRFRKLRSTSDDVAKLSKNRSYLARTIGNARTKVAQRKSEAEALCEADPFGKINNLVSGLHVIGFLMYGRDPALFFFETEELGEIEIGDENAVADWHAVRNRLIVHHHKLLRVKKASQWDDALEDALTALEEKPALISEASSADEVARRFLEAVNPAHINDDGSRMEYDKALKGGQPVWHKGRRAVHAATTLSFAHLHMRGFTNGTSPRRFALALKRCGWEQESISYADTSASYYLEPVAISCARARRARPREGVT